MRCSSSVAQICCHASVVVPLAISWRLLHAVPAQPTACFACRSYMPLVAADVEWSPAVHADFPPAFRAAARALLLVDSRGQLGGLGQAGVRGEDGDVAGNAPGGEALPSEVLHQMLRLAARDLPAWMPELLPPAGPASPCCTGAEPAS